MSNITTTEKLKNIASKLKESFDLTYGKESNVVFMKEWCFIKSNLLPAVLDKFDTSEIVRVIFNAINIGLTFNKDANEIYLMPRAGALVTVITANGYRKLFKKACPNFLGYVFKIICENDKFEYDSEKFWKLKSFLKSEKESSPKFFYLELLDVNGNAIIAHTMTYKDIYKRRAVATTQAIWAKWEDEMALKTVAKFVLSKLVVIDTSNKDILNFINQNSETLETDFEEVK